MAIPDPHMKAWRAFLEAHARIIRRLERELQDDQDLSLGWYDVLLQLHEAGGRMRMGELAERLLISRSATSRFVDRLEGALLLERERCDDDRRGMWVTLTEQGRRRLRAAAPTHLRGIERHFADNLTAEEAHVLMGMLGKLGPVP